MVYPIISQRIPSYLIICPSFPIQGKNCRNPLDLVETCRFSFKSSSEPEGQLLPGAAYLVFWGSGKAWTVGARSVEARRWSLQGRRYLGSASKNGRFGLIVRFFMNENEIKTINVHLGIKNADLSTKVRVLTNRNVGLSFKHRNPKVIAAQSGATWWPMTFKPHITTS